MLSESQRDGNTGILIGADDALLKRYIPKEGFKSAVCAFLVKTGSQNILIDTGTGSGGIIVDKVKKLLGGTDKVDAVLITHLHGDHFGSLHEGGKAVFPKAKVWLSAKEREYFTKTRVNQGAVSALAPYGERVVTFDPPELGTGGKEILPGISAIAAYGHTPGHVLFMIENGGEKLLIVGDLLHVAPVQFPRPDISATYDSDAAVAATVRKQVLDYAAKNKIPIGGMHLAYPGIGTVSVEGTGFNFTPIN
ncbi:MAG: MBL fold metallo-hydrolase [Treponema sp.]|jgi:glyoxylase-like metal-dependent hydrolase (beta-lactamase superfamily II)|nr:MBL fold metallo-hydrolase [Treponema sp.]